MSRTGCGSCKIHKSPVYRRVCGEGRAEGGQDPSSRMERYDPRHPESEPVRCPSTSSLFGPGGLFVQGLSTYRPGCPRPNNPYVLRSVPTLVSLHTTSSGLFFPGVTGGVIESPFDCNRSNIGKGVSSKVSDDRHY